MVGGGDGTVGTVAGVMAGTGVPLGILPLGTLNHFAKDLGLPLDVVGAARLIAAAVTRDVDVAEVNGRVFVNNSSVGIYPLMVTDRDLRRRRHGLGKWLAMSLAFVRMLWRFPRRRLRLRAEGWTTPYRTPCLFVGNNEYSMELLSLGQRRRLDGGELWLGVVKQRRPGACSGWRCGSWSAASTRRATSRPCGPARSRSPWAAAASRSRWTARSRPCARRSSTARGRARCG